MTLFVLTFCGLSRMTHSIAPHGCVRHKTMKNAVAMIMGQRVCIVLLLLLPSLIIALSNVVVTPTREELLSFASASGKKVRGSSNSRKAWRYWSDQTLKLIQSDLQQSLMVPLDNQALNDLSYSLGVAADVGTMPSFDDEIARQGYALNYFCRAQNMADLLFSSDELLGGGTRKTCRICSLGGGPGFDFVAATLIASYRSQQQGIHPTRLRATIFDYQEGWASLVRKMSNSTCNVLGGSHSSCYFELCDITAPLSDPLNAQCRKQVQETDIWFCSYCVAENARKLRDNDYVFFQDLFSQAKQGALFVFTETTHRLWPELANVAGHSGFDVSFPSRFQKHFGKRQLVLRKRKGAVFGPEEKALCMLFERDNEMHERKIQNGTVRQARKVRGAKR